MSSDKALTEVDLSRWVRPLPPDTIAALIAVRHGITVAELLGRSRYRHVMAARHELYRTLKGLGWSWGAVGAFVGGRDQGSVRSSFRVDEKAREHQRQRKAGDVPASERHWLSKTGIRIEALKQR